MRSAITTDNAMQARAVAGTRVVLIALNIPKAQVAGLKGFSFQKAKQGEQLQYLLGKKAFQANLQVNQPGATYSTKDNPIQSFLWSDEIADPDTAYEYVIEALYGDVHSLQAKASCHLQVQTEKEDDGKNAIYFNLGAIASQAFARKFNNEGLTQSEIDSPASPKAQFLSRGLVDGLLKFVSDTKPGQTLHIVAYEHTFMPVLKAFVAAQDHGVHVQMVYDAKQGAPAAAARRDSGLEAKVKLYPRSHQKGIAHNKFIVRLDEQGLPLAVWTGSTNFTPSGFLGQTNVGHVCYDAKIAAKYEAFFQLLKDDPAHGPEVTAVMSNTPNPANLPPANSTTGVMSPRTTENMLGWYAERARDAQNTVLFTAPFEVDLNILAPLSIPSSVNSFLLLEKPPKASVQQAQQDNPTGLTLAYGAALGHSVGQIDPNTKGTMSYIKKQQETALDHWFLHEELLRGAGNAHIFYIHTKILAIDPLSDDPLVCTGSANFSNASLVSNDENMLLIRGDTRVADIYLTEIDRIFRHFSFRDLANAAMKSGADPHAEKAYMLDDTDGWWSDDFNPVKPKSRRREMFYQPEANNWTKKAPSDGDIFSGPLPTPIIAGYVKPSPKPRASTPDGVAGVAKKSGVKKAPGKKIGTPKKLVKKVATASSKKLAKKAAKAVPKKRKAKKP